MLTSQMPFTILDITNKVAKLTEELFIFELFGQFTVFCLCVIFQSKLQCERLRALVTFEGSLSSVNKEMSFQIRRFGAGVTTLCAVVGHVAKINAAR